MYKIDLYIEIGYTLELKVKLIQWLWQVILLLQEKHSLINKKKN